MEEVAVGFLFLSRIRRGCFLLHSPKGWRKNVRLASYLQKEEVDVIFVPLPCSVCSIYKWQNDYHPQTETVNLYSAPDPCLTSFKLSHYACNLLLKGVQGSASRGLLEMQNPLPLHSWTYWIKTCILTKSVSDLYAYWSLRRCHLHDFGGIKPY